MVGRERVIDAQPSTVTHHFLCPSCNAFNEVDDEVETTCESCGEICQMDQIASFDSDNFVWHPKRKF